MKELFRIKGFSAYLLVLVLNVTLDIAHKITIQNILIKSYEGDTLVVLSAIINMFILIPFVLLFSPSGYLSDRYSKTHVIRYAAASAIALTLLIALSYMMGWFVFAFIATLLLATQSAIYSPAKYGIIKEIVGVDNLGSANAIVQALTIVFILLSSIAFTVLFEWLYGGATTPQTILQAIAPIGAILIVLSIIETLMAYRLPMMEAKDNEGHFAIKEYLKLNYLKVNFAKLTRDRNIWLSIIAIALFWGVAQVVIAAFPAHYKAITGDDDTIIIQSILAISSIGLIIGSFIAGYYSKKHIEHGFIPLAAIGLALSLFAFATVREVDSLYFASLIFGFFGGLFIVPLNVTIQFFAPSIDMGKVLAGKNFIENIVMILFLVTSIALIYIGFSTTYLFIISSIIIAIGSLYAIKQLPHLFVRMLLFPILRTKYSLIVQGVENIPKSGGVLMLGNHISWIDWLVVQLASPRAIKFVMTRDIYNRWYLKKFLEFFDVIAISNSASKSAIKAVQERLDRGEVVALFPEGHISYNGQLGEFKKGFELILKDSSHPIVPFYIRGLWGSTFSRARDHYKQMREHENDVIVAFGEPLPSTTNASELKQKVIKLSYSTWSSYIDTLKPLHYEWLRTTKKRLFKRSIVDSLGVDLSGGKLLTATLLFSGSIKSFQNPNIGIILPSSSIGAIVNLAILTLAKRAINLNYTAGQSNVLSAIERAKIEQIITSRAFIEKLEGRGIAFDQNILNRCVFVEDISKSFGKPRKIATLLQAYLLPSWLLQRLYFAKSSLDDVATILFSSGSESAPKGVELTHRNLIANIKQVSDLLNFKKDDAMLNSLPIFHSFGLSVTLLLPLTKGVEVVSIPDPTDALGVGKMVARYRATIIFGTSTFYRIYTKNRKLHPLMFQTIRLAVAGAEKLSPEVKEAFKEKFGLELFEGYGATETAPVVSVNVPDALEPSSLAILVGNKTGSVGQPLPGTIVKIVNPTTLEEMPTGENGLILIGGIQVMKGYLDDAVKTQNAIVELDGIRYYKSGDKGHIDSDGFITIVDRYSRFAKIGGEMISLGAIEEAIAVDEIQTLAVALEDSKKGEKIILLHNGDEEVLKTKAKELDSLMRPSAYIYVEAIPKLASGKSDFGTAKKIAMELA
ncbi:MAG: MFS transporter [Campylobacterales bacterium]|nr:MFS transporter [Campylobacterales bacterium]